MPTDITDHDDMIDIRDVIARFEELESARAGYVLGAPDGTETPDPDGWTAEYPDDADELETLESLLSDLKGYGGDEQWRGDWYPIVLIRDSYFRDYAEQLADDIGAINSEATWPNNCVDWQRAARELQTDYSTVEFGGFTYWYR